MNARILPLLLVIGAACNRGDVEVTERVAGTRAPLSADCDDQDPLRCLLPWPSSNYLVANPDTATGVQVDVEASSLPIVDDPKFLNAADGFSRLTPVATAWSYRLNAGEEGLRAGGADLPIRIYVAEPGHALYGQAIPVWTRVVEGGGDLAPKDLLVAYPMQPLPSNVECVVVVLDDLVSDDGEMLPVERTTELVVGLADPETQEEADLVGYHAPLRLLLADVGIDPAHVLRAWDFVTRSEDDPVRRVAAMTAAARAEVDAGTVGVVVDVISYPSDTSISAIVMGYLEGAPYYRDEDGLLPLDDQGNAIQQGVHSPPFRIVIPSTGADGVVGTDYRVAMYGHGTGGDVTDDSFDEDIAATGTAKVGIRFAGWNGDELVMTIADFTSQLTGTERSSAALMQSVADSAAILSALEGELGDILAAETLAGETNPAVGRRPDVSHPVWVGGSQGGAMGMIISAADDRIQHAVLNVPAAAWSHIIPDSLLYTSALEGLLVANYGDPLDVIHGMVMSQNTWDDVDGAVWAEQAAKHDAIFLLQESMGDPIAPNAGTEILASAIGLTLVGPVLGEIPGLETADTAVGRSGMTQYRVPDTGQYDMHGFAARDTLAGAAAFEQIATFLQAAWAGESLIEMPAGCTEVTADGSCDFSGMWDE
jgi:hypothetical protein